LAARFKSSSTGLIIERANDVAIRGRSDTNAGG
jgi:hypothetical protein